MKTRQPAVIAGGELRTRWLVPNVGPQVADVAQVVGDQATEPTAANRAHNKARLPSRTTIVSRPSGSSLPTFLRLRRGRGGGCRGSSCCS